MSVLIKGMEMPTSCEECSIKSWDEDGYVCPFSGIPALNIGIQNDCPLVEVPTPHGRLIDADATMKQWGLDKATKYGNETAEQQYFSYSSMMMYEIVDILEDAPTVVEQEDE